MRASDLELLGLDLSEATRAAVDESFKRIAPSLHPDTGGDSADPEKLTALVEARDRLLEELARPVRCVECRGEGHTIEMVGFVATKVRCQVCKGAGTVPRP